jgi:hypothetical protein
LPWLETERAGVSVDGEPHSRSLGSFAVGASDRRAVAVLTTAIWIGAIFAGRMIVSPPATGNTATPGSEEINFEDLLGLPPAK